MPRISTNQNKLMHLGGRVISFTQAITPPPVGTVNEIEYMRQANGLSDAAIRDYLRAKYQRGVYALTQFPVVAEGESFLAPHFGTHIVLADGRTFVSHNTERNFNFYTGDRETSEFAVRVGDYRYSRISQDTGLKVADIVFPSSVSKDVLGEARVHWSDPNYMTYFDGTKVMIINRYTSATSLWWDLGAGLNIGDQYGRCGGGDGNDFVRVFDTKANKWRSLFLITLGGSFTNAAVVDLEAKVFIRQVYAAESGWTFEEVPNEQRAPLLRDLPVGTDQAFVADSGDHIVIQTATSRGAVQSGSWAHRFDQALIGLISPYSSHTDTFQYVDGTSKKIGLIAKDTAGIAATGDGDTFLITYTIVTNSGGVQSVANIEQVQAVDWAGDPVAGTAQVSASRYNRDFILASMKPGQSTNSFYGKDETFEIPINASFLPPGFAAFPCRLYQHNVLRQTTTANQPEDAIGAKHVDSLYMIAFRSDWLGLYTKPKICVAIRPPRASFDELRSFGVI